MSTSSGVDSPCRNAALPRLFFSLSAFIAIAVAGCGSGGPPPIPREDVAGTVTFDGKPIPYGGIRFDNQENQAISTMEIKNGAYRSEAGQGPAAGKNKVVVAGFEEEDGKPLWSGRFSTDMDIAKGKNDGKDVSIDKKKVKPFDPKKWSNNEHDRS